MGQRTSPSRPMAGGSSYRESQFNLAVLYRARGDTKTDPSYGRGKDPVLLLTGLARALGMIPFALADGSVTAITV